MAHLKPISLARRPMAGQTSVIEQAIVTLLTIFFFDWDNFPVVIQNLQKYYAKTPD